MKILVVGNGAREHAIAWKLAQSPRVDEMLVAPGNAGTAQIARNVPLDAGDIDGLLRFVQGESVDFTVVGPEAPLADGIADRFHDAGLPIFGPTRAAARIETSKSFAKELMMRHGIPTGKAAIFDEYEKAHDYVSTLSMPVVIKADGLAAGKAVLVAGSREAALDALRQQMVERRFGAAGERVLVEEYLEGQEVSVFAFVDGKNVSTMVAACDYKRALDGDAGPNTGGMGAYSPPPPSLWTADVERRVRTEIMEPVAGALAQEGCEYRGVLYAGLMVTHDGPKVIEFNCRLGDPEAQVVLPRLKSDLLDVMISTARGGLDDVALEWDPRSCVGVVVASGGYPGDYTTGYPIEGLDAMDQDVLVFHAGTDIVQQEEGMPSRVVSSGGRVLTVAALGDSLKEVRLIVYSNAGRLGFTDASYRSDIAALSQDVSAVRATSA